MKNKCREKREEGEEKRKKIHKSEMQIKDRERNGREKKKQKPTPIAIW